MHGSVMAGEIDYKCLTDVVCNTLVFQQELDIEQITRMLAVQGRTQFTAVQICNGQRLGRNGEFKQRFRRFAQVALLSWKYRSAQYMVWLYFYGGLGSTDEQLGNGYRPA